MKEAREAIAETIGVAHGEKEPCRVCRKLADEILALVVVKSISISQLIEAAEKANAPIQGIIKRVRQRPPLIIREVVEWMKEHELESMLRGITPETAEYIARIEFTNTEWQAKLKEWGIET